MRNSRSGAVRIWRSGADEITIQMSVIQAKWFARHLNDARAALLAGDMELGVETTAKAFEYTMQGLKRAWETKPPRNVVTT